MERTDTPNPYSSPKSAAGPRLVPGSHVMSVGKALLTVGATTVLGALLGTAVGALIGILAPDYYRSIFYFAQSPNVNIVQLGAGLGLLQGGGLGMCVGLALVAIFCWYRSRLEYFTARQAGFDSPRSDATDQP